MLCPVCENPLRLLSLLERRLAKAKCDSCGKFWNIGKDNSIEIDEKKLKKLKEKIKKEWGLKLGNYLRRNVVKLSIAQ